MAEEYPIINGNEKIGLARLSRQGLYFRIECHCISALDKPIRISVKGSSGAVDLGLCVPMASGRGLVSRISAKRVGEGPLEFYVSDRRCNDLNLFVPIYPDQPFGYLGDITNARLSEKEGQIGVLLKASSEVLQGNDPNP